MDNEYYYYMEDGVLHRFHLEREEDYDGEHNSKSIFSPPL